MRTHRSCAGAGAASGAAMNQVAAASGAATATKTKQISILDSMFAATVKLQASQEANKAVKEAAKAAKEIAKATKPKKETPSLTV